MWLQVNTFVFWVVKTLEFTLNRDTRISRESSEYTRVNNIYEIAGNVFEWATVEKSRNLTYESGWIFYFFIL